MSRLEDKLIENGIKNLNEFGYPLVTKENILTDIIYAQFFEGMLKDNLGHGEEFDIAINRLLKKIKIDNE